MDSSSSIRRPCFIEDQDDGLASLAEMEAGISGYSPRPIRHPYFLRNSGYSPRTRNSPRIVDHRFEDYYYCGQSAHFLEACFLCKKHLAGNRDIFMYRGDTPFCSEECRQEQIEIDEGKEKSWNLKSSAAMRNSKKEPNSATSSSSSSSKNQNYPYHVTGTVAAA